MLLTRASFAGRSISTRFVLVRSTDQLAVCLACASSGVRSDRLSLGYFNINGNSPRCPLFLISALAVVLDNGRHDRNVDKNSRHSASSLAAMKSVPSEGLDCRWRRPLRLQQQHGIATALTISTRHIILAISGGKLNAPAQRRYFTRRERPHALIRLRLDRSFYFTSAVGIVENAYCMAAHSRAMYRRLASECT